MPTAIAASPTSPSLKFAFAAIGWGLALFAALRTPWLEAYVVLPATRLQGQLAAAVSGDTALPVSVTLACSGTDVIAMSLAAILAYPARWPSRLAGVAGAIFTILALNTIRIGSLSSAVGAPWLFDTLHLYLWPALLTLATAAYVYGWMRLADRAVPARREAIRAGATRAFVILGITFVVIFALASPWYLASGWVFSLAAFIAHGAAGILAFAGVPAVATGNVVVTARGGFAVTQECIATPLIPVYLAAVIAYVPAWHVRVPALFAVIPLFMTLGMARLLIVALPPALIGSPLFFVHAFYQLLTGAVLVCAAAWLRHRSRAAWPRALAAIGAGALVLAIAVRLVASVRAAGPPFDDPQGATALLPAFQVAFFAALWIALSPPVRWKRLAAALVVMGVAHAALFGALHVGALGWLAAHVPEVRAWALALPIALAAAMQRAVRLSP